MDKIKWIKLGGLALGVTAFVAGLVKLIDSRITKNLEDYEAEFAEEFVEVPEGADVD